MVMFSIPVQNEQNVYAECRRYLSPKYIKYNRILSNYIYIKNQSVDFHFKSIDFFQKSVSLALYGLIKWVDDNPLSANPFSLDNPS